VSSFRWLQSVARFASLAAALLIGADDADVRLVDGLSFGAGGSGGFALFASAAAADTVMGHAPVTAQAGPPVYPGGSLDGLFKGGGLLGEFAAGFLGSGLLGLLFGRGLIGGIEGVPSYLGLLFQLALLVMLGRLIWTRWRSRDANGAATLSPRQLADNYLRSRDDLHSLDAGESGRIELDSPPAPGSSKLMPNREGSE
jgi:hypothetical protein